MLATTPAEMRTLLFRPILAAGLAVLEMLATSVLFVLDKPIPAGQNPAYFVRQLVLVCVASALAFLICNWQNRQQFFERWHEHAISSGLRQPVLANLILFGVLSVSTIAFSIHAAGATEISFLLYALLCMPLMATGVSLLLIAAPVAFWRDFIFGNGTALLISLAVGLAVVSAGVLSQYAWQDLAGVTLSLSYTLLSVYEPDARMDYGARLLGAGSFDVHIDQSCSGYEGIGLVIAFLALFLWIFRKSLRFPTAFLLIPLGMAAIWLLNAFRISALVSVGAHVSPEIAIGGFHSQAGWMAFLIVSVGLMWMATHLGVFSREVARPAAVNSAGDQLMLAYLAPFMALMGASILVAASTPYESWLYGLKVMAAGLCLWVFRRSYLNLVTTVDPLAVCAGVAVGLAWIFTGPDSETGQTPAAIVAMQSAWFTTAWLLVRAFGAIVVVPLAEELAFRGLLHRWLIARRFETVDFARFSWLAFTASSVLFGLMHQRWIAGTIAGAVFALTMYRSGRLSSAIYAHMTANAIIVLWAIWAQNWALL